MIRLSGEVQTLFAELSEQLRILDSSRTFASLAGSFTRKTVNENVYWYFKTSEGAAGQREFFVGPDNAETKAIIRAHGEQRPEAEAALTSIQRLSAMLRQGGAMHADPATSKVVSGLANAGIFRLGAMLVGTHAFTTIGNLLGVRWQSAMHTQDIDFAARRILRVAVPQSDADLPRALDSLNMGFLPVPGLDRKEPATSFKVRGSALRVDLLTPSTRGPDQAPVFITRLKAAAQPLEFLDYLLEVSVPVPFLNGSATLVNVPDPAHFALHKLVISGRRDVSRQTKAAKDREQAAEILRVLQDDRPGDIALAVERLNKRNTMWRTRLRRELAKLPEPVGDVVEAIRRQLTT